MKPLRPGAGAGAGAPAGAAAGGASATGSSWAGAWGATTADARSDMARDNSRVTIRHLLVVIASKALRKQAAGKWVCELKYRISASDSNRGAETAPASSLSFKVSGLTDDRQSTFLGFRGL